MFDSFMQVLGGIGTIYFIWLALKLNKENEKLKAEIEQLKRNTASKEEK